ncbi:MAG: tail-specific protease [Gammaproteobacteria bacterium]|nr:tail-specific protease [Gammaproteobacteria bacterium]
MWYSIRKSLFIGLLSVSFFTVHIQAKVDVQEQQQLLKELNAGKIPQFTPEEQHPQASQKITALLVNYHYRKPIIDDHFSEQVFDAFLERLDANHSYLLQEDLKDFENYRHTIDNSLRIGDVTPAYKIFNKFIIRWVERYQFALQQLEKSFDFTLDEEYLYDRTESEWSADKKQLNDIWRKRVKNDVLNLKLAGKEIDEIKVLLSKRYKASMRRMAQSDSQDVFWYFMNSVAQTVEPHTNYFSPRAAENFEIDMKLSLDGIGAVLQTEDVYTKIVRLVSQGPADKTGEVKPDDRILAVGQGEDPLVDVIGWRLDDVVDLIRGKSGTLVRLEILPEKSGADANTKVVSITRDTVKLEEQSAKAEIIEVDRDGEKVRFGVIDIPKFYIDFQAMYKGVPNYKSTTRDVRKLLKDLEKEKISGIIVDLRSNGGGALVEATQLTGLFIDKGPVVQERNYQNEITVRGDTDTGSVYDGPLAVLVNRSSASASEIFAAAIQDYGRGIIIGEQTFGKGTVQVIQSLDKRDQSKSGNMGQLKFTYSKFYRINGESTQHKGVIPDIEYPSAFSGEDYGESSQPNALPWDTISPVDYLPLANYGKLIPLLKEAHKKRIDTDKEFRYLIEDINEYLEHNDIKAISLNLVKRKTKRELKEEKILKRENKRRLAKGLEAVTSIDDIEEDEDRPDPRLEETAEILDDLIQLIDGHKVAYIKQTEGVETLEH